MEGLVYRAAKQSETDPFEFIMSDETVDRMGDVIVAEGWDLGDFKSNPIALLNHNADAIIGRWENVRVEGKRLVGRFVFAEPGTDSVVDKVAQAGGTRRSSAWPRSASCRSKRSRSTRTTTTGSGRSAS